MDKECRLNRVFGNVNLVGYFPLNNMKVIHTFTGAAGEETFIVSAVRHLELQVLEGFEEFWVPLAIYGSTVALSVTLTLAAVWQFNYWTLCIIVGYIPYTDICMNMSECTQVLLKINCTKIIKLITYYVIVMNVYFF